MPRSLCRFFLFCLFHALLTPFRAGLRAQLPPLKKGCSPSRAIIPNASRNSRILVPHPVRFVLLLFFPATQELFFVQHDYLLPWAIFSSSNTDRCTVRLPPFCTHCPALSIANHREMNQQPKDLGSTLGPGAVSPLQEGKLGCKGHMQLPLPVFVPSAQGLVGAWHFSAL